MEQLTAFSLNVLATPSFHYTGKYVPSWLSVKELPSEVAQYVKRLLKFLVIVLSAVYVTPLNSLFIIFGSFP